MPLLSLLETMPNISKTASTIKISLRRIQDMQHQLNTHIQLQQQEEALNIEAKTEHTIRTLEESLEECQDSVRQLEEKIKKPSKTHAEELELPPDIESSLEGYKREIQHLLSQAKNNVEMKLKEGQFDIHLNRHYQKLIPSSFLKEYREDIKNIYREVEMTRLNLPKADLLEFHNFTCQRITYELYEMK